jgi:nucleotide-binding universal stress UspA family protein
MVEISYKEIMVPTDGSDYSLKAGEHAVYLAKITGAKLYILNVVDTDLAFHSGIHYSEELCDMQKSGNEATGKIKQLCDRSGVPAEEIIAKGRPADTIVFIAQKVGADCIVIGSLGMSAIERVLIGSVSEKVVRHAKCPVLVVRDLT